jgi:hypothetical protein
MIQFLRFLRPEQEPDSRTYRVVKSLECRVIQPGCNSENVHSSRGKQGNNREGNQRLDHHA